MVDVKPREMLNIVYKDNPYELEATCTSLDLIKKYHLPVKNPVATVINGYLTRLSHPIRVDSVIEFIERGTPEGERIYESSVIFLFVVAFTKKFPQLKVFIQHSIDLGVYAEVKDRPMKDKEVKSVLSLMRKIVDEKIPINRIERDWEVSLKLMREQMRTDIINLFRYYRPGSFKTYEIKGVEEVFYLPLLPNTFDIDSFDLRRYRSGFVILFQNPDANGETPFQDRPKVFNTYREHNRWGRAIKVRTVGHLNRYIMTDEIKDFVKVAESLHEKKIAKIADEITQRDFVPRVVLIAGPSSSGKTTFSKRLGIQLMVNGFRPVAISLDDYFIDRDMTPLDANGDHDFECLEAIDVKLFTEHLQNLIKGEEVELPHYNFYTGKQELSGKKLRLESDQILIIEGIHGINPKLTETIAEKHKFRILVWALTQLNLHRHDRIPATDTRLLRRIVRDSLFRGYTANDTLLRWRSVRAGEEKHIFPLQDNPDAIFNSALFYELSVLKLQAEKELLRVESSHPMYIVAQRLLKFLTYFLPLVPDDVPKNSILREFIGGSSFKY